MTPEQNKAKRILELSTISDMPIDTVDPCAITELIDLAIELAREVERDYVSKESIVHTFNKIMEPLLNVGFFNEYSLLMSIRNKIESGELE